MSRAREPAGLEPAGRMGGRIGGRMGGRTAGRIGGRAAGRAWRLVSPVGLSARLLLLTAAFVMLGALLVIGPSLAAYEEGWLTDRVRLAEVASLAVEASPAGTVSDRLAGELLEGAGVISVSVQTQGVRRLLLAAPRLARTPVLVDLRDRKSVV